MKNTWRLTTDLLVLFFNGQSTKTGKIYKDVIAFCPVEKKEFKNNLIKLMGNISFKEISLVNNGFKLRINSSGNLEVKSDKFPNPETYYTVSTINISEERLPKEVGYLISRLPNDKGSFDENFEISFSNNNNLSIKFICDKLDIYNSCLNELNRRTMCSLFKKTKKFIPGHKYESIDESIIYLGNFKSSRIIDKSSNTYSFTDNVLDYEDVFFYIDADSLTENDKSIKDIFNNRYFSSTIDTFGIKETRKLKPMVDSGEVLINDIDSSFDLSNYRLNLINNLLNRVIDSTIKIPVEDELIDLTIYNSKGDTLLKNILLPLVYYSEKFCKKINDKTIENIIKYHITNMIRFSIFELLNSESKEKDYKSIISDSLKLFMNYKYFSSEWTIEVLIKYFSINFNDGYLNSIEKFDDKIKLEYDVCDKIIKSISSIDFEDYCKLIQKTVHKIYYSRQRYNTCTYKLDIITIEDLFGKSEFTNVLKNICRDAINNSGKNVDSFIIKNIGTRKTPLYYVSIRILLDDIINYFNGIDNIPNEVISSIKFNKFDLINIDIDLDIIDIK